MKVKKKIIGSLIILSIFIVFLVMGYIANYPMKDKNDQVFSEKIVDNEDKKDGFITIYINGEIKNPGIYKLSENSRIADVVKISGGFTKSADKRRLNLAKKIKDEDYIYVDKIDNGTIANNLNSKSDKININKATKEELKKVPGIGEVTAEKIINYREQNGGFDSLEQLKKVDRIGEKTFEKFRDKLDIR